MLTVEPWAWDGGDEELRSVGVGSSVGHGEEAGFGVLLGEVFVSELLAVDASSTGSISTCEISSLEHELSDDSVEWGSLVSLSLRLLAKLSKVLGGLGDHIVVELEVDLSDGLA